jgi:DNA-binding FadR family transcriptional regulator
MTLSLKLIVPESMRDNAINVLLAQGIVASRNGIGLRVNVAPSAKMAPLQTLLAQNIEVSNFEIENGY